MILQERLRAELPAVLALGSNLGDREAIIRDAVRAIDAVPGITVTAASGLIETPALKPHGVDTDAPAYLNAVITVRTALEPLELLAAVNAIEQEFGRVRETHWGDRTLDVDVIDYAGMVLDTERLSLPHPRAHLRAFVLEPWLQIQPQATLPGIGRISELPAAHEPVQAFAAEPLR